MKKILLVTIAMCSSIHIYAQVFSFQMYFSDAAGNMDTITLGYAPMATDSIDSIFGEVNIISTPFKSGIDVRITNESGNFTFPTNIGKFHTKKQIIDYYCLQTSSYFQGIDILTKHWPVTASWDKSLFNDSCRRGSFFTSMSPGGWWDFIFSPSN